MADFVNSLKQDLSLESSRILDRKIDKDRNLFLKGLKSTSSGQKEDPTYFGFRFIFDFGESGEIDPTTFLPSSPLFRPMRRLEGLEKFNRSLKGNVDELAGMMNNEDFSISGGYEFLGDFFHGAKLGTDNIPGFDNLMGNYSYIGAEKYLYERRSSLDTESTFGKRADMIRTFKNLLRSINEKSPWFFQSIEGIDQLLKVHIPRPIGGNTDRYNPTRTGILNVRCMESIDLRISALAELYRKATYDYIYHRQLIPHNLLKFRMWIVVSEIRNIQIQRDLSDIVNPFNNLSFLANAADSASQIAQATGFLDRNGIDATLKDKTSLIGGTEVQQTLQNLLPYVLIYQLDQCEFNFDSSYPINSVISNAGSNDPIKNEFKIHVGRIIEHRLQYNILSDLIKNESSFSSMLIADSYNMSDSIIPTGMDLSNSSNLLTTLASRFVTNTVGTLVSDASAKISDLALGNVYGFRLQDLVQASQSLQSAVATINATRTGNPQNAGLGGPPERAYPSISADIYPNTNDIFNPPNLGNILGSNNNSNVLPPTDVYPTAPGPDLGLPSRNYPTTGGQDEYPNTPINYPQGAIGDVYPNINNTYPNIQEDQYLNTPGTDLGVPERNYETPNEDVYKTVPGPDLGVPNRVYKTVKDKVYNNNFNYESIKEDVYPNTSIDQNARIDENVYASYRKSSGSILKENVYGK